MAAILEVQDIHTYYGDAYVLQGLSLQLEQGQILGLLGRNGVGKSTLVNSIVGFNPPRRGKVVFKGDDITQKSSFETVRSGMGPVSYTHLRAHETVLDLVCRLLLEKKK